MKTFKLFIPIILVSCIVIYLAIINLVKTRNTEQDIMEMELKKEMQASTQEMTDLIANGSKVSLPQSYTIGSSDFKILSPYPLKETKIVIPENLIAVLEKMEVFVFESNPYFDGMVSYH